MRKDVSKLEKLQKRFTKMITELTECRGKNYEQRLNLLGFTSLEDRHYRADMIQVFRILNESKNIYSTDFLILADRPGRKNNKKLYKRRS